MVATSSSTSATPTRIYAVDPDARCHPGRAIPHRGLAPQLPLSNFREEAVESSSFPDSAADVVISSAVLHFARDESHFQAMLRGTWRLVKPNGLFFCRLASSIGMEGRFTSLGGRRFALPDGTERFLVDEPYLLALTSELGGACRPAEDHRGPGSPMHDRGY